MPCCFSEQRRLSAAPHKKDHKQDRQWYAQEPENCVTDLTVFRMKHGCSPQEHLSCIAFIADDGTCSGSLLIARASSSAGRRIHAGCDHRVCTKVNRSYDGGEVYLALFYRGPVDAN